MTGQTLAHYGVKGMKWGVRKEHHRPYGDKVSVATEGSLKRAKAKVQMVRYMSKGVREKSKRKFDEEWYDSLSTGREYVAKNQTLNRIVKGVDDRILEGRLYVSHIKFDSEMYKATIPGVQKFGKYGAKDYHSVYQVSMEAKRGLTMPSPKTRVDTFINLLDTQNGRDWLTDNGYKGEIDELNKKEVGLKYYDRFNKYAGNQSVKFNDVYFNDIRKQGYNALTDDNDAGIWSKKPVILLSPKRDARITEVRQLSADEINSAQKDVLKLRYGSSTKKE